MIDVAAELPLYVTNSGNPPLDVATRLTLQAARQTVPRMLAIARACRPDHGIETREIANFTHASERWLAVRLCECGSDKSTNHNYEKLYSWILGPRRDEALCVFEVGLGSPNLDVTGNMGVGATVGASLRAFRDYLPHAKVFGADVDRRVLFDEDRIATYFVDQTDPSSFDPLISALPGLDLIIDDGLHSPHANLAVVEFAVKKLNPHGWLVVEDIREDSLDVWRLIGAVLPPDRFWSCLVRALGGFLFVVERHK